MEEDNNMRGLAKFVVWTPLAAALACSAPAPVAEEPMEEAVEAVEESVEDRNKAVVMRYMQEVVNDRQLEVWTKSWRRTGSPTTRPNPTDARG